MSAEVVNLRSARKAKRRGARADMATTNRAFYGRTRAERDLRKSETDLANRVLDGHRLASRDGDDSNA